MSAQIIATEPTIERPGEATRNQADDVVIAGPNEAEIPVGAIQLGDDNAIAAYSSRSDQLTDDTSGQSAMPPQIIATVPALEKLGEAKPTEANGVATTELNDAEDAPVGALQPSDESSTAKHSTLSDDTLAVDGTSGQGAMPAQIIATVPALEKLGEARPTEANGVATTELNDAEDAPVGAIQPRDESSTAKYSSLSDDTLAVDGTSGQSAMPAQIIATVPALEKLGEAKSTEANGVATTALNDAEDAPVGAAQPNDESSTAKHSTLSDDTPTVDGTSEQSVMPAQVIATGPALEKLGEAQPTETDGVATTALKDAEDAPVGAAQPNDESSTARHSTLSDDTPTVDGTSEQSAMPAPVIATGPTLEKLGEAKPTETDGVATTALNDAEDAPVEAIQPNDEDATVKSDREARN